FFFLASKGDLNLRKRKVSSDQEEPQSLQNNSHLLHYFFILQYHPSRPSLNCPSIFDLSIGSVIVERS
ncbi:MAG: hypothetical protein C0P75_012900, partial [Bacilli bacterium]